MKKLFMVLLWYLGEKITVNGLNLYPGSSYADMEFEYEGKSYKLSLTEKEEEEK